MLFGTEILKYRDEILKDLADLIAVPSVRGEALPGKPFGEEPARALAMVLYKAQKMGLAVKNVDNYAGHAEYGSGNEAAAVAAHVDVVPAGEGWDSDPFTLTRKGNLYFGRGTADDKGAAVVALYCLKALKDAGVKGNRRLRVIFGSGEETGMEDLHYYFQKEEMPVMGFTPDSDYGICNREKGILRLNLLSKEKQPSVIKELEAGVVYNAVPDHARTILSCSGQSADALKEAAKTAQGEFTFKSVPDGLQIVSKGKAAHAMQPQSGFNAAAALIRLLSSVFSPEELGAFCSFLDQSIGFCYDGSGIGVQQSDEQSGPLTLNLGILRLENGQAKAGIDIRYPVTSDGGPIFSEISRRAEEAGLSAELLEDGKPLYLPGDSKLISILQDSYACVTGKPAELYATGGGTYARAMKGNAVAFGPFFPDEPDRRLHNTNESIDIDRFMIHAQICLEAMYRMLTA
ncbi:Sapep family Mn(2+)-dependent dipeptidase [Caproicibacter fermentans]|uniref:Sapep family Mn(2+)-dependent dipeptidase n=1 Tax=Caproicibacter fermentans TaxID=2576756 RepID=A0A7G8TEX9_9FIRM|nr:Sapep family Mn(2+)-dependent dipeptidase [Caproicibacter fermentans]QNK42170.1 Sapep family Mn(2+)-dependent dipeptidase [Caproicibacter fermentans]